MDGAVDAQPMEVEDAMEVDGEPPVYGPLTQDASVLADIHSQRDRMLLEIRENLDRAYEIGTQEEIWYW